MGDISAEPSMEEILSSIKRIIAEEGDSQRAPARKPARTPVQLDRPIPRAPEPEEVLELSEPMPVPDGPTPTAPLSLASPAPAPRAEPIVSREAAAASRGSLEALTRLVVKPEPGSDNTLEGLVRDMLRPMLSDWLDAHLPAIVEQMVAREIERITGSH